MPTAYTAIIEQKPEVSLREFALKCARAFDPRDEDINTPPRLHPVDTHCLEQQRRAEGRLVELRGMSKEAAQVLFDAEVELCRKHSAASVASANETERRYKAMRAKVEAWTPPSVELGRLRRFMLEQIALCESDWTPCTCMSELTGNADQWLAAQITLEESNVAYYAKKHEQVVERHADRKRWLEALNAAFPDSVEGGAR